LTPPTIETERLLLRPPLADDAVAVTEEISDPEVMRYIGTGETGTFEDAVEMVERMRSAWSEDGFGRFIPVRKEDGLAIGRVGLLAWDPVDWRPGTRGGIGDGAEIELGWSLRRAAWGRGYATEAAAAVRDWALSEVAPRRLISLIHPGNERSMTVATKIGEQFDHDVTTYRGIPVQLWALRAED
jgi:RimJ/RimL family protein N-acetyltransferase